VPDSVLLEAAKDSALLVVGSHGRGVFSDLLLGSVSERCVRHAKCPVVVVHREDQRGRRAVIAQRASSERRSPAVDSAVSRNALATSYPRAIRASVWERST